MKHMNTMKFTGVVLKNLFSKPVTRPYPEQPREYPERTRGHVEIDIDTCVLCSLCARKCPTGAITVDRAAKLWEIERFGCIQCGCCVETCPKKCLSMKQSYTQPDDMKLPFWVWSRGSATGLLWQPWLNNFISEEVSATAAEW